MNEFVENIVSGTLFCCYNNDRHAYQEVENLFRDAVKQNQIRSFVLYSCKLIENGLEIRFRINEERRPCTWTISRTSLDIKDIQL